MKHKLLLLYGWFVRSVLYFFPDIPVIMRLRGWLYGLGMKSCGKDFQVAHNAILNSLGFISVGNNVYIANNNVLIGNGVIFIGSETLIGPNCLLAASEHVFFEKSYRFSKSKAIDIKINKGCWIGGNSTIIGGAVLPQRSILAGGSVLLKKTVKVNNSLYAGNPAKFIKKIN